MSNRIRLIDRPIRMDPKGSGEFGAPRGNRKHRGIDLVIRKEDVVDAPVSGIITKHGYTYADDLSYRYVEITDECANRHRLFYVKPCNGLLLGAKVKQGDVVGTVQCLEKRHGKLMKQHVHYEILNPDNEAKDPVYFHNIISQNGEVV